MARFGHNAKHKRMLNDYRRWYILINLPAAEPSKAWKQQIANDLGCSVKAVSRYLNYLKNVLPFCECCGRIYDKDLNKQL